MRTAIIAAGLVVVILLSGCGTSDPHSETINKGGSTTIKVSCV